MNVDLVRDKPVSDAGKAIMAAVTNGEFKVSELVDVILQKAVLANASDIHFEPMQSGVRVRFRIDGVFQDLCTLPASLHDQVVARIKVMADLLSHRREVAQEGRIRLQSGNRQSDFRVSVVPTVAGERVVIRMFSPTRGLFDIDALGYRPDLAETLKDLLRTFQGMVVLTGPAGSGKTTTLYACLMGIYREMDSYASIVSIEDPVEYGFGLWGQMQVNRQVGLDFSHALSAFLRQDPEVIMVGEIRDTETCDVALRAGLTGHLVLTTIHSGSSFEVITRVLNMGIEPFVVASALSGILAQRLVRVVCTSCKAKDPLERAKVDFVERALGRSGIEFVRGKGCPDCGYTGYRGRVPVAELLVVDDPLRSIILETPSTSGLKKFSIGRGMKTLAEDALEKVVQGVTTLDEVLRNVSLKDML